MTNQLTTLKEVCASQDNPFHEFSFARNAAAPYLIKNLDPVKHTLQVMQPPYVYCGLVEDAHIFGKTFVKLKDGSLVYHCQGYRSYELYGLDDALKILNERKKRDLFTNYIDEECIFLGGTFVELHEGRLTTEVYPADEVYPANFGHFIFEFLNRLVMFDQLDLLKKLPIVVYDHLPSSWDGFFELMGISKDQLVRVPVIDTPAFRKVWVSSSCHYRDSGGHYRFWGEGLSWQRQRIFSSIGGAKINDRRRIYLGRGGAKWRKISNEQHLIELLEEYEFEFPDMESMSPREQVEKISGAELVVSALGAGTIITHFAPEHCVHILLAPQDVGTGPYGGMAGSMVLRQVFERIDCKHTKAEGTQATQDPRSLEMNNYEVDLGILRAKLDLAMKMIDRSHINDALRL